MAVVGCYSLDLYCDSGGGEYGDKCPNRPLNGPGAQYTGNTENECIRQARRHGWTFNRDKTKCYCSKGCKP